MEDSLLTQAEKHSAGNLVLLWALVSSSWVYGRRGKKGAMQLSPSLHIPSQYWGDMNFILVKPTNKQNATWIFQQSFLAMKIHFWEVVEGKYIPYAPVLLKVSSILKNWNCTA